jgi:hypothetical protein
VQLIRMQNGEILFLVCVLFHSNILQSDEHRDHRMCIIINNKIRTLKLWKELRQMLSHPSTQDYSHSRMALSSSLSCTSINSNGYNGTRELYTWEYEFLNTRIHRVILVLPRIGIRPRT